MTTRTMQYGVILPGGTAVEQLESAKLAEQAGWDGVFVWEAAYGVDAWALLAGMAVATDRVRLGTLLTPLPWRRPWKVAGQVATLDQLSGGRAILAVGVGAIDTGLPTVRGEATDLRERAAMLDEGIDLIRALWSGTRDYHGERYDFIGRDDLMNVVRPVQDRIPIWVVGAWARPKSMRRVLRCDGVIPEYHPGHERSPQELLALRTWLAEHGADLTAMDVVSEGETPAADPRAAAREVGPWREAGATWWLETRWNVPGQGPTRLREMRDRIAAGPPRP
jgi:alkanesulfonate monooxygenase SsuD/methylene tetrahydromethanopterin reductase-like flavin-dependent oxidoreductase (luciferase family)